MQPNSSEPDRGRRLALRLLTAAGLCSAARLHAASPPTARIPGRSFAAELLHATLPHPEAARSIGVAYLAQQPAEASILLHALEATLAQDARDGGEPGLANALDRMVRGEYAAGDTRVVDGWVLSTTECRLYALAALTHGMPTGPSIR